MTMEQWLDLPCKVTKYEIRFFQVGTASKGGDAIFVRLYDEEEDPFVMVIDGGYSNNGDDIIRYMVDECRLNKIDCVINTHPDIDHISGLITLFKSNEIEISHLMMNRPWKDADINSSYFKDGRITDTSLHKRIIDKFKKAKELEEIAIEKIGEDNIISPKVGRFYFQHFLVLAPEYEFYRRCLLNSEKTPETKNGQTITPFIPKGYEVEDYIKGEFITWIEGERTSMINETSIVILLKLPNGNFLFTGDVGKEGLNTILNAFPNVVCNMMQLPHHGSRKNIDPDLLKKINVSKYYLSCPPDGFDFGHPSRRLINKILEINPAATIFCTKEGWFSTSYGLDIEGDWAFPLKSFDKMDGKSK